MQVETLRDYTFQIRAGYYSAVDKAIRKTVIGIVANTQQAIIANDTIDTSALLTSVYASTYGSSGHSAAASEASAAASKPGKKSGRPHKFEMLPEEPLGPLEGIAAVGAEYALNVELGTFRNSPQPAFIPASEWGIASFEKATVDMINREVPNR